jgi:two-component system LytT family sensor kinase
VSPRTGPGSVHIAARVDGDRLCLEVRDNGVGLTGKARLQFDRGVGLANTRDRLDCLYGERSRLEFSEVDTGLTVRMAMPLSQSIVPESTTRVA